MKLTYKVRRPDGPVSVVREYTDAKGRLHRPEEDGPALELANGTKSWWRKGKAHRVNGPAVENVDGSRFWYIEDCLHRLDGPAAEYANGAKFWLINGEKHREDGPAVEHANGEKEWWLHDEQFTEAEFTASRNPRQALREAWRSRSAAG